MSTRREPAGLLVDVVGVEELGVADELSNEEFFDDAATLVEAEAKFRAGCRNILTVLSAVVFTAKAMQPYGRIHQGSRHFRKVKNKITPRAENPSMGIMTQSIDGDD